MLVQFIILQIMLLGAVVIFLKKVMMGSTESAVNRLNESYMQMNQKKEELEQKINQAQEDYEARKKMAERIAEKIKNDADKEARDEKDELLKKAREEAERIIADTVGAKEKIRQDIVKEEKQKIVEYCRELLEGVYEESLGEKVDNLLIADFFEDLEKMEAASIPAKPEEVEVVTRRPLTGDLKIRMEQVVSGKMETNVKIKETISGEILGGIVLKFGSLILDGSIAGKLKEKAATVMDRIEKGR